MYLVLTIFQQYSQKVWRWLWGGVTTVWHMYLTGDRRCTTKSVSWSGWACPSNYGKLSMIYTFFAHRINFRCMIVGTRPRVVGCKCERYDHLYLGSPSKWNDNTKSFLVYTLDRASMHKFNCGSDCRCPTLPEHQLSWKGELKNSREVMMAYYHSGNIFSMLRTW